MPITKYPNERRKPTGEYRLQAHSIPEIVNGITMLRLKLIQSGAKHFGRKLSDGPVVNAVMAAVLAMPDQDQIELLKRGLDIYEDMLTKESP